MTNCRRTVLIMVLVTLLGCAGCQAPSGRRAGSGGPTSSRPSVTWQAPVEPATSDSVTAVDRSSGPTGIRDGVPRGLTRAQRAVDLQDADQVATAFVVRLETWDTRTDRRPNDAVRRAVEFAGPQLRSRLLAAEPRAAPGQRWNALVDHRGWTSVRTRLGGLGPEPTTDRRAVRAVSSRPTDHGADGWTSVPDAGWTYLVTLHRGRKGAKWTVVGYTIQ